jgi:hypothetical protein
LTYDHTQTGSSNSSSFPALVSFIAAAMKSGSGDVQSSAGADILFFSDSGLTTQIPSQIVYYDNVNGIGWFRVLISTLSSSTNGTIYMAVGNASPSSRTTGVWDAHTVAMWPFDNGTTLDLTDVVAGMHTLTGYSSPQAAAAKVAGAYAAGPWWASASDSGFLLGNVAQSLSAWIYMPSGASNLTIFTWGNTGSSEGVNVYVDTSPGEFAIVGGPTAIYPHPGFSTGSWYHIAFTFDGTNLSEYVNGVLTYGPSAFSFNTVAGGGLGTAYQNGTTNAGSISALRVSSVARGSDWIKAEYNNENAPGDIGSPGFWTFGARTLLGIARRRTIVVQ